MRNFFFGAARQALTLTLVGVLGGALFGAAFGALASVFEGGPPLIQGIRESAQWFAVAGAAFTTLSKMAARSTHADLPPAERSA
jgi:L-cystine uptake protein TcyP (sodium:dicarboxylate symporter family)